MEEIKKVHETMFKPAKHVKGENYFKFPNTHDPKAKPPLNKKNFRDPETGEVMKGPINFLTNPLKKGQVGKGTQFMTNGKPTWSWVEGEEYDRGKVLAREELD